MPARRPVNLRSVGLGLFCVVLICLITPYNDYVLQNTFFIGFNLPVGLTLLTFLFAIGINGPLNRWWPRYAFSTGETMVTFTMALVSCSLPSSGLMRYLPGSIMAGWYESGYRPAVQRLMSTMHLPHWLFPTFATPDRPHWLDPVMTWFYGMHGGPAPSLGAWITPVLAWGIFLFALYGAIFCMMTLARRQFNENERLLFPLAQIELALIEQPEEGRALNVELRKGLFWIAFGGAFALQVWNGAGVYWPKYIPRIPMDYNLHGCLSELPWANIAFPVQMATISLMAVGVTYFLSSSVAFSLWSFVVMDSVYRMMTDVTPYSLRPGEWDEHLGGIIAFVLSMLWLGRRHWWLILRHAVGRRRSGESDDEYLSYRFAFWAMLICAGIMVAWLSLAGCSVIGAFVVTVLLLLLFLTIAKIIAQTGLVYGQLLVPLYRPWQLLSLYSSTRVSMETFYMTSVMQVNFYDFREPLSVYASHALKLADATLREEESSDGPRAPGKRRSQGRSFIGVLALSVAIAYFVSFGSTLWMQYHFRSTLDSSGSPINYRGTVGAPDYYVLAPTLQYQRPVQQPPFSPADHIAAGFVITAALALLRMQYMWWPLHPVGFLMLSTTPLQCFWFSIMLGWLAKVVIVRLGGASLYVRCKPLFLGLIIGECSAAGFWLIVALAMSFLGLPFHTINLLPN